MCSVQTQDMAAVAVCLLLLVTAVTASTGQNCIRLNISAPITVATTSSEHMSLLSHGINATGSTCFSFEISTCSKSRLYLLPVDQHGGATAHRFMFQRKTSDGKIVGVHKWCTLGNGDYDDISCSQPEPNSMASSCETRRTFWVRISPEGAVEFGNGCWNDSIWSKQGNEPFTLGDIVLNSDNTALWTFGYTCPGTSATTTGSITTTTTGSITTTTTGSITTTTTGSFTTTTTPTAWGSSKYTEWSTEWPSDTHAPSTQTTSSTHSITLMSAQPSTAHDTQGYSTETGSWHDETSTLTTNTEGHSASTESQHLTATQTSATHETTQTQLTGNGSHLLETTQSTGTDQDGTPNTSSISDKGGDSNNTTTGLTEESKESTTKTVEGSNNVSNNAGSNQTKPGFNSSSNVPCPPYFLLLLVATSQISSVLIGSQARD